MVSFTSKIIIWVLYGMTQMLDPTVSGSSWCQQHRWPDAKFEKKTDRFWEFDERSGSWVELNLPFALMSCINDNCNRVGSIEQTRKDDDKGGSFEYKNDSEAGAGESPDMALPLRKRISLTKMSDASVWATGQSGSIYERFWNGVQWVIAPHDLQISTGFAVSVFIINQTILALSQAGVLYQLQLSENAQPIWTEFRPTFESSIYSEETEPSSAIQIKSGVVSHDGQRLYFTTMNRSLLELGDIQPPRWINHGQPPGGDVAAIADAETIRSDVVFTVSSSGDLYEFDKSSRPSWKKHIWSEPSREENSLIPSKGCTLQGLIGAHSQSLFLLTKGGYLMERRLHQRKWKWIFHGAPKAQQLTAITPVEQTELNEKIFSLFFNTASGFIFEYRLHKQSGVAQGKQSPETWVNHMHPLHAKVARGFPGLQLQVGRILFTLDDGRLAELHLSGIGGEASGPAHQINIRRKASSKYEWSILDAPETEGWNAEYCTEERGPLNCIGGIKETLGDDEQNDLGMTTPTRRRKGQTHQTYISPSAHRSNVAEHSDQNGLVENSINANFRMRAVQAERSFFIITDGGLAFEYLYVENMWLWLRHEHSTRMKGVVGHYNGSLFLIDTNDHLLIRERNSDELSWINCTAMRKGRKVVIGPPWDGIPGKAWRVTAEDALFFVNKNGRLLQFMELWLVNRESNTLLKEVALRKFKWKDCQSPPNTKVATVVDQEVFRKNIVFVIGRNGRLYQYNRVTELWHEHYQSPHLVLARLPGTAMRQSLSSLTGSLFMLSEDGGLIEYHWNALDGWNWVEHGTPYKNVNLVGAPGPCFEGSQLFLIGSDGSVYLRYLDERLWQWKSYGFPHEENMTDNVDNSQSSNDLNGTCDEKVASVRPIPFSEDSVIFELRDGRLAELRRADDTQWMWSRIIATPTSRCIANYWEALAS